MNCQEFESNVNDMARGALMDARTRAEAESHEGACARCRALLADERALSTGLRALAASTRNADAPARVESSLLAAFRARAAAAERLEETMPPSPNVVPLYATQNVKQWSWRKTFATAALAAAAALTLFMIIPPDTDVTPPSASQQIAKTNSTSAPNPSILKETNTTNTNEEQKVQPPDIAQSTATPPVAVREVRQRRTTSGRAGFMNASLDNGAGRDSSGKSAPARDEEFTTDFMPLVHGGQAAGVDAGQVVRVELPRSALASIGLPVSAERANERVKADVVIGEDGTARAIRFVR